MAKHPVCLQCIHYYVTHEPAMPYGCRAMHFKSAHNPAQVVLSSSGMECQLFAPKKAEQGDGPPLPSLPRRLV